MKIDWLRGCATALVTPFGENLKLDENCFRSLVERQIDNGVKLLVPCGTTGENVTMSEAERLRVIQLTVEVAKAKGAACRVENAALIGEFASELHYENADSEVEKMVPHVIAGVGSNNTAAAIEFTAGAKAVGADMALVVAPYYNKPTPEGMYQHFKAIADSAPALPMMLYNVPSRTASNISAETTLRLARDCENIVATKEASGNYSQIMEIIASKPAGFAVFSGDDASALPLIALGADGLVSVCSNEIPHLTQQMVNAALANDWTTAREIHYQILPLMEANFIESSPAPCKFVMKEMGLLEETLRLPLVTITDESRKLLRQAARSLNLF